MLHPPLFIMAIKPINKPFTAFYLPAWLQSTPHTKRHKKRASQPRHVRVMFAPSTFRFKSHFCRRHVIALIPNNLHPFHRLRPSTFRSIPLKSLTVNDSRGIFYALGSWIFLHLLTSLIRWANCHLSFSEIGPYVVVPPDEMIVLVRKESESWALTLSVLGHFCCHRSAWAASTLYIAISASVMVAW